MPKARRAVLGVVATSACLLPAEGAHAEPVDVLFSGTATFVAEPLQATVGASPTITGLFSYEWDGGTVTRVGSQLLSGIEGYADFTVSGDSGDLAYTIGFETLLDDGSAQTFPSSNDDEANLFLGPAVGPQVDGKDLVAAGLILESLPFTEVPYYPVPQHLETVLLFDKTRMFRLSYGGVSRIDFALVIVPEPARATQAVAVLAVLGILGRGARRSRNPRQADRSAVATGPVPPAPRFLR